MSQPQKRVAISIAAALAALSSGGAVTAQTAPAPQSEVPPPTMDTNEDGKADAWDRDANNIPDAWDTNGDGKPDLFDNDGDGKPDDKAAKPAPKPNQQK